MALKNIMNTLKNEGYIIKRLDQYLLGQSDTDDDRRYDFNSPSSASSCPRGVAYGRLSYERDACSIDAKTRRIFDNGTGTHERLQKYMLDCGLLAMDEVPVFDDEYKIQGHTDGLLNLTRLELGVLEIKSINTDGFRKLMDAKEEHKDQGITYMYCLENRRKFIRSKCVDEKHLDIYLKSKPYVNSIKKHYTHLKSGSHYTAEQKFKFKLECHRKADRILWKATRPINKMIFLYEDKNTQMLKEFCVKWDDELVKFMLDKYTYINGFVERKELPPRPEENKSKSCNGCRWCSFQSECWVV